MRIELILSRSQREVQTTTLRTPLLATAEGFEPPTYGFGDHRSANWNYAVINLAGAQGFEPRNAGIKIRCLTAWRYPKS